MEWGNPWHSRAMGHGEATDAHSNVPLLSFVLLGPLCFWDPVPPELAGSLQPSHPALSDKKPLGSQERSCQGPVIVFLGHLETWKERKGNGKTMLRQDW